MPASAGSGTADRVPPADATSADAAPAAVGVVALAAGPAGAWLVVGVGLFVVLGERAVEVAWRQRA